MKTADLLHLIATAIIILPASTTTTIAVTSIAFSILLLLHYYFYKCILITINLYFVYVVSMLGHTA